MRNFISKFKTILPSAILGVVLLNPSAHALTTVTITVPIKAKNLMSTVKKVAAFCWLSKNAGDGFTASSPSGAAGTEVAVTNGNADGTSTTIMHLDQYIDKGVDISQYKFYNCAAQIWTGSLFGWVSSPNSATNKYMAIKNYDANSHKTSGPITW